MRVRVGLLFCLIPITPGFTQSAGRVGSGRDQTTAAVAKRRPRPDEFFAHPEELCKVLSSIGIETSEWEQIGVGTHFDRSPFMCEFMGAPPVDNAPTVNRDAYRGVEVLFRVSGDTGTLADVISIAVSIVEPSARATGQEYFSRLLAEFFQSIGKPEPPTLLRAIAGRRYYLSHRAYGLLWFNFVTPDHPGYKRVFWFRLSKSGPG